MTQATITDYKKYLDGHLDVGVNMFFNIPSALSLSGTPLSNISAIVNSYGFGYDTNLSAITKTELFTIGIPIQKGTVLSTIQNKWTQLNNQLSNFTLTGYDKIVGSSWDGNSWS